MPLDDNKPIIEEDIKLEDIKKEFDELERGLSVISNSYSNLDSQAIITVSEDQLKAYLRIEPPRQNGRLLTLEDVVEELKKKNISLDLVDLEKIKKSIEKRIYHKDIEIARGKEPTSGEDARLIYQINPDCSNEVGKYQVLYAWILPSQGKEGLSVYGRSLPPIRGNDIDIYPQVGIGRYKNIFYAKDYGRFRREGNLIYVEKEKIFYVLKNIKNLDFLGRLQIHRIEERANLKALSFLFTEDITIPLSATAQIDICILKKVSTHTPSKFNAKYFIYKDDLSNCIISAKNIFSEDNNKPHTLSNCRLKAENIYLCNVGSSSASSYNEIELLKKESKLYIKGSIYPPCLIKFPTKNLYLKKPYKKVIFSLNEDFTNIITSPLQNIGFKRYQIDDIPSTPIEEKPPYLYIIFPLDTEITYALDMGSIIFEKTHSELSWEYTDQGLVVAYKDMPPLWKNIKKEVAIELEEGIKKEKEEDRKKEVETSFKLENIIDIKVSEDKFSCFIKLTRHPQEISINTQDIINYLHTRDIKYGILSQEIEDILTQGKFDEYIKIAEGKKPILKNKPEILYKYEGNNVGAYQLIFAQDDNLLSSEGIDIYGQVIKWEESFCDLLINVEGDVEVIDNRLVIAQSDNQLYWYDGGSLWVGKVKIIKENITEDIEFDGLLVVEGNLISGVKVEVRGLVGSECIIKNSCVFADFGVRVNSVVNSKIKSGYLICKGTKGIIDNSQVVAEEFVIANKIKGKDTIVEVSSKQGLISVEDLLEKTVMIKIKDNTLKIKTNQKNKSFIKESSFIKILDQSYDKDLLLKKTTQKLVKHRDTLPEFLWMVLPEPDEEKTISKAKSILAGLISEEEKFKVERMNDSLFYIELGKCKKRQEVAQIQQEEKEEQEEQILPDIELQLKEDKEALIRLKVQDDKLNNLNIIPDLIFKKLKEHNITYGIRNIDSIVKDKLVNEWIEVAKYQPPQRLEDKILYEFNPKDYDGIDFVVPGQVLKITEECYSPGYNIFSQEITPQPKRYFLYSTSYGKFSYKDFNILRPLVLDFDVDESVFGRELEVDGDIIGKNLYNLTLRVKGDLYINSARNCNIFARSLIVKDTLVQCRVEAELVVVKNNLQECNITSSRIELSSLEKPKGCYIKLIKQGKLAVAGVISPGGYIEFDRKILNLKKKLKNVIFTLENNLIKTLPYKEISSSLSGNRISSKLGESACVGIILKGDQSYIKEKASYLLSQPQDKLLSRQIKDDVYFISLSLIQEEPEGSFILKNTKYGLFLFFKYQKGASKLTRTYISDSLHAKGIRGIDHIRLEEALCRRLPGIRVADPQFSEDIGCKVIIEKSKDLRQAYIYLQVPSEFEPQVNKDMILAKLNTEKIPIDDKVNKTIDEILDKRLYNQRVLLKEAIEAVKGKDGYIEYSCYDNQEVIPGQLLAYVLPPTSGEDGVDVEGNVIKAKKGDSIVILCGCGVVYGDDKRVYALEFGRVVCQKIGEKLNIYNIERVSRLKKIEEDNIKTENTLDIDDNLSNIKIETKQSVYIKGNVSDCYIYAGGDVVISGEVKNTKIVANYINLKRSINSQIFCNILEFESLLEDCKVEAKLFVKSYGNKSAIKGGEFSSTYLDVYQILSEKKRKTQLVINKEGKLCARDRITPNCNIKIGNNFLYMKNEKRNVIIYEKAGFIREDVYSPLSEEAIITYLINTPNITPQVLELPPKNCTLNITSQQEIPNLKRYASYLLDLPEDRLSYRIEEGLVRFYDGDVVGAWDMRWKLERGNFSFINKEDGLYLEFNPPNNPKDMPLETIVNEVVRKQYKGINLSLIEEVYKKNLKGLFKIGPRQYDKQVIHIEVSKDETYATCKITPPKEGVLIMAEDIIEALTDAGVKVGIKKDRIIDILQKQKFGKEIIVAEAIPPQPPQDAKIIYKFNIDQDKINLVEDSRGRIDFKELNLIRQATKGMILAEKVPKVEGKAGVLVTGRPYLPRQPQDIDLVPGRNTELSQDGMKLYSQIDGHIVLTRGRRSELVINVDPIYEVKGDLDLSVGNIKFCGVVSVQGEILGSFKIIAGSDILIKGNVYRGHLEAGGNIIIGGGIQSSNLLARGDIVAKYVDNSRLTANGSISIKEEVLNSRVVAGDYVEVLGKRGRIIGGLIRANNRIQAKSIGNEFGIRTRLEVGLPVDLREEVDKLIQLVEDERQVYDELSLSIKTLIKLKEELRRDFPEDKQKLLEEKLKEKRLLHGRITDIFKQVKYLKEKISERIHTNTSHDASICAYTTIYPNVILRIYNLTFYTEKNYNFVKFCLIDKKIEAIPMEDKNLRGKKFL